MSFGKILISAFITNPIITGGWLIYETVLQLRIFSSSLGSTCIIIEVNWEGMFSNINVSLEIDQYLASIIHSTIFDICLSKCIYDWNLFMRNHISFHCGFSKSFIKELFSDIFWQILNQKNHVIVISRSITWNLLWNRGRLGNWNRDRWRGTTRGGRRGIFPILFVFIFPGFSIHLFN